MSVEPSVARPPVSPWNRLNLRCNPFGEPPTEEAGGLVVLPAEEELVEPLGRGCSAVQVLGDCGRGKTARLRLLEHRFPGAPYVYLAEDRPPPPLPEVRPRRAGGPALLLDEAQRLPRRRRRLLFRRAARSGASLALAGHVDLRSELEAAGLDVWTVRAGSLGVDHLLRIVERRLRWARSAPGPVPTPGRGRARWLVARFGDDLRSLLDHLYEDYQDRLGRWEERASWRSAS